ncbi:MAG: hypothetical protein BWX84_02409 [Verrucomicrobia bacterium ADurb.Bin118]|nr:MAG: hypothetical protein BWX84_02409 [Verrucomicrobia bacterium ADurb.Bin118]
MRLHGEYRTKRRAFLGQNPHALFLEGGQRGVPGIAKQRHVQSLSERQLVLLHGQRQQAGLEFVIRFIGENGLHVGRTGQLPRGGIGQTHQIRVVWDVGDQLRPHPP